jgi:K+-sensing histidine kinase KdpD
VSSSGKNYRVNWQTLVRPRSAGAYAFATFCVGMAALIRWGLGLVSEEILPLPTFYPAVLFSALIGGPGAGVFAAILGGVIGWWAFMPPRLTFFPLTFGQQISLLVYFFACLLIVWGQTTIAGLRGVLKTKRNFGHCPLMSLRIA